MSGEEITASLRPGGSRGSLRGGFPLPGKTVDAGGGAFPKAPDRPLDPPSSYNYLAARPASRDPRLPRTVATPRPSPGDGGEPRVVGRARAAHAPSRSQTLPLPAAVLPRGPPGRAPGARAPAPRDVGAAAGGAARWAPAALLAPRGSPAASRRPLCEQQEPASGPLLPPPLPPPPPLRLLPPPPLCARRSRPLAASFSRSRSLVSLLILPLAVLLGTQAFSALTLESNGARKA